MSIPPLSLMYLENKSHINEPHINNYSITPEPPVSVHQAPQAKRNGPAALETKNVEFVMTIDCKQSLFCCDFSLWLAPPLIADRGFTTHLSSDRIRFFSFRSSRISQQKRDCSQSIVITVQGLAPSLIRRHSVGLREARKKR